MIVLTSATALLGVVIIQRWLEVMLARRNAERLIDGGAIDHSGGAYLAWMALQGGGLFAIAAMMAPERDPPIWMVLIFAPLFLARVAMIVRFRRDWILRLLTTPEGALIHPLSGRYRALAEAVLALEAAALALALNLPALALALGLAHAALALYRSRLESTYAAA